MISGKNQFRLNSRAICMKYFISPGEPNKLRLLSRQNIFNLSFEGQFLYPSDDSMKHHNEIAETQ